MSKRCDVIYENGVFRPLQPVNVPERRGTPIHLGRESAHPAITAADLDLLRGRFLQDVDRREFRISA
jgi:predicted DNA-binding antitoxin AbrB/MazE fold protein